MTLLKRIFFFFSFIFLTALSAFASEADLAIPDLHKGAPYTLLGGT
ncbi:MAG: hypothetical protein ACD_62C00096G0003 [uncultured bacterium]|nr:MAG: hypothetical protein ACD_62C00096G0003 [uncultured bacterium]HLD44180.1 hypothetical protein [bacterium]